MSSSCNVSSQWERFQEVAEENRRLRYMPKVVEEDDDDALAALPKAPETTLVGFQRDGMRFSYSMLVAMME